MDSDDNASGKALSFLKDFTANDWQAFNSQVRSMSPGMGDMDLAYKAGNEEQFIKDLQERTGKSRQEILNILMKGQRGVSQEKSK